MNVCHINTYDFQGGASRAMFRVHRGLVELGINSVVYTLHKSLDDPRVLSSLPRRTFPQKVVNTLRFRRVARDFAGYWKTRPAELEPFSDDRTYHWGDLERQLPPADLYNLHWIAGFVDVGSFMPRVPKPVIWTLHDMQAFTGGCHYDVDCDAYTRACGRCPQLGSRVDGDLSNASWQRKSRAYAHRSAADLQIVTPSRWLQRAAQESALLRNFPVHCIPNGIDTSVFRPVESNGLRSAMDLTAEDRVILFVAEGVGNRRKGFQILIDALRDLDPSQPIVALTMGGGAPRLQLPFRHIHAGSIGADGLMAALYSVADLTVVPSLQDNLPNVVLESMACGTPVVGFDTGGIPDMVRPGETGWLVPVGQVDALRDGVRMALSDTLRLRTYGERCREVAEQEYRLALQAHAYADLYARVLGDRSDRRLSDVRSV